MKIFTVKELLHTEIEIDSIIVLKGWVRNRRDSKAGLSFIMVNDGSCFDSIQVVAENTLANYESEILKITKDCSVIVTGKVVKSLGKGQSIEIVATIVEI